MDEPDGTNTEPDGATGPTRPTTGRGRYSTTRPSSTTATPTTRATRGPSSSDYERRTVERTLAAFRTRVEPYECDAVLDLGCGNGAKTRRAVEAFPDADVLGVDVSAAALDVARERASGATYERADVREFLARTDREFDVILGVEWLCYLAADTPATELLKSGEELEATLAPDGAFVGAHVHVPTGVGPAIGQARTARVVREALEGSFELVGRERYEDRKRVALDEDEPELQPYEVWTMVGSEAVEK